MSTVALQFHHYMLTIAIRHSNSTYSEFKFPIVGYEIERMKRAICFFDHVFYRTDKNRNEILDSVDVEKKNKGIADYMLNTLVWSFHEINRTNPDWSFLYVSSLSSSTEIEKVATITKRIIGVPNEINHEFKLCGACNAIMQDGKCKKCCKIKTVKKTKKWIDNLMTFNGSNTGDPSQTNDDTLVSESDVAFEEKCKNAIENDQTKTRGGGHDGENDGTDECAIEDDQTKTREDDHEGEKDGTVQTDREREDYYDKFVKVEEDQGSEEDKDSDEKIDNKDAIELNPVESVQKDAPLQS